MTSRILPFEEWDRLPEYMDPIIASMSPGSCRICVVEDAGDIVGHLLLFPVLHAEGLWIAPQHRKRVSVLRHLLTRMKSGARSLGFDRVWGASDSDEMTRILAHVKLDGRLVPAISVVLPCERTQ